MFTFDIVRNWFRTIYACVFITHLGVHLSPHDPMPVCPEDIYVCISHSQRMPVSYTLMAVRVCTLSCLNAVSPFMHHSLYPWLTNDIPPCRPRFEHIYGDRRSRPGARVLAQSVGFSSPLFKKAIWVVALWGLGPRGKHFLNYKGTADAQQGCRMFYKQTALCAQAQTETLLPSACTLQQVLTLQLHCAVM